MTNEQLKAALAVIFANLQRLKEDECIRDTGLARFAEVQADVATLIAAPAPPPVQAPPGEFEGAVVATLNGLKDYLVGLDIKVEAGIMGRLNIITGQLDNVGADMEKHENKLVAVGDMVQVIGGKVDASEEVLATIMINTTPEPETAV